MIVSDQKKFVYMHSPKTGGSSVTEALAPYSNKQGDRMEGFGWQPQFHYGAMHASVAQVWASMGRKQWEDYFWFAFVRNPFDLVISAWKNRAKQYAKPEGKHKERFKAAGIPVPIPDLSLEDFLQYELGEGRFLHIRRTQTDTLLTGAPKKMNMIGRFETLNEDWAKIAKILDIKNTLPHRNKSNREQGYKQYYTPETRSLVESFYHEDLDNFNYEY